MAAAAVQVPAHLAGGEVGCFGWSPARQLYACANVVEWPGDACVAIDLVARDGTRSVPVAGGARCGSAAQRLPAEVLGEQGVVSAVREVKLERDVAVDVGGFSAVLRMGDDWQLVVRCADGKERVVAQRLPGDFVEHFVAAWAPGAPFVTVAGFSHTAMEPGAPVEAVQAAAFDLRSACRPAP